MTVAIPNTTLTTECDPGATNDGAPKIQGEFRIPHLVLSQNLPLVSQDFADKAVVVENFAVTLQQSVSDEGGDDQFTLELTLVLDGRTIISLKFPLGEDPPSPASNTTTPETLGDTVLITDPNSDAQPVTAPAGSIFWVDIQRSIGPLHIEKIGFNCVDDDLQVLLNAGLATSAFSVELSGLSVTVPISGPPSISDVHMHLGGLAVSFSTPALSIEGGLLCTDFEGQAEYDGALLIKTPEIFVGALGSFTSVVSADGSKQNSLFGFAFLDAQIGGPPCFFVTGLSAGFGYNRSVKAPSISEVGSFPLLAGLNDPSQLGLSGGGLPKPSDLISVLGKVDSCITPELGEYWFAAGIQFTSFELIHSNVVAILEVGQEFDILVLGKSYASFPPTGETYAYVELDIEVVLQPEIGLFKAEAVLAANSYVLDPDCHLVGGFAFYAWFGSNPHAGDFVFTVGGYHPAFTPPTYYPSVQRLGFNWPVSDEVLIKGGAYFALTPACMMAGGSLEITYQSGNLRAWFTAYADLLIYWKPFYFTASIGVDVGVSYHVHFLFVSTTLHFDLGATIDLHGPPTGGEVHIDLDIVSFTVSFGADEGAGDQAIAWSQFRDMLAKPTQGGATGRAVAGVGSDAADPDLCHLTITGGLLQQVQDQDGSSRWLVRADEFTFDVASCVPMTGVDLDGATVASTAGTLAVRPMKIAAIQNSSGTVRITSEDGNPMSWNAPQAFNRSLPQALWGQPVAHPSGIDPNQGLVQDCLVGLKGVSAASKAAPQATGQIAVAKAFTYFPLYPAGQSTLPRLPISAQAATVANDAAPVANSRVSVVDASVAPTAVQRAQITSALAGLIGFTDAGEDIDGFDAVANFATDPLVGKLAA